MKRAIHIISLLLVGALIAIAAGCTSASVERRLQTAEALIDSYPDSALNILSAIRRSDLSDEHRARHALLLSQVYDKKFIDIADDSLISIAYNYYTLPSAPDNYRTAAYYYRANVDFNAKDYPSAIFHAIVADTLAAITGDLHYRGMANNLIAHAYRNLIDFNKELKYSERSFNYFKLNNDSIRSRLALRNIALCHIETGNPAKALEILNDSLITVPSHKIAECLLELNRISDFLNYIKEHPVLTTSPVLNGKYALTMVKSGNMSEADSLIDIAYQHSTWHGDSSFSILAESELLLRTEQWDKLCKILIKENKRYDDWLKEIYSVYDSRGQLQARDYISALSAQRTATHRQRLIITIVVLSIALLIAILIGISIRTILAKRLLEKELAIRDVLKENASASDRIQSLTDTLQKLTNELESNRVKDPSANQHSLPALTDAQISELTSFVTDIKESLRALCLRHQHTSSSDTGAVKEIMRDIQAILSPDTVRALEQYIDMLFDGLAVRSRKVGFHDKDILLLSLIRLGFTNSEIALFVDTTYSAVAKRKSRLISRLIESGIIVRP